jgi:hypothetical protein
MARRDRETAQDRPSEGARRANLTDIKPGEVTSNDEAADPSVQNAENPMLVREEVKNTSDSSGLHADDEAKGETMKDQLKRGLREIQPMD